MWKDFKEFALKGNLIEVAVGLIMALALVNLINSLVENVLMPLVGIIFGEPSFDEFTATVNESVIKYGTFITAAVAFVAIALVMFFLIVRPYRSFQARRATGEEPPAEPAEDIVLLREIRDSLRRG